MVGVSNHRHADPPRFRGALILAAVWSGLVAAGLELVTVLVNRHVVGQFAFVGRDVWWTVPLVNTVIFGTIGVGLVAAAMALPNRIVLVCSAWIFSLLMGLVVLLNFPSVHRAAALILAVGLATQAARTGVFWRAGTMRMMRRMTPWMLVFAIAGGIVVRGQAIRSEWRAMEATPGTQADAPNVLLIVLDTVRAASLSLYGHTHDTTPGLVKWGKEGVVFDRAISTAPWTLPAHASMLTGRWEPELSTDWTRPLDGRDRTLAESLSARGYATAAFSANTDYFSAEVGLARGFAKFEDYMLLPEHLIRSAALGRAIGRNAHVRKWLGFEHQLASKRAPEVSNAFATWVEAVDRRRPWFAMLNYYDAHRPYQAKEPFNSRFAAPGVTPDPRFRMTNDPQDPWQPLEIEGHKAAYEGAIAYLDDQIQILFDNLRRRGILDRTVVIITSDHGEEFGEHGLFDHGNSLYFASLHVPLVIVGPGIPGGRRIADPVSLRDIPATVLDAIGTTSSEFPGQSLSRTWRGEGPGGMDLLVSGVRKSPGHPGSYPVSAGDMIGLMRGTLRFVKNLGSGREEMFDVGEDPWERRDLVNDPARRTDLEWFRVQLEQVTQRPAGGR